MRRFIGSALAVGMALMLASPAAALDNDKVVSYYRKKSNIPPAQTITVTDVKDSPIKGAKEGTLKVGGQSVPFLASADGKYVVFGAVEDITVDPSKAVMAKINLKNEPFRGKADADVVIVEYSDFQCPFCSRGYATMEDQVIKTYGDQVKFYYKNFPLAFHKWAEPAAIAAECAKQQKPDSFWVLYNYFFKNQKDLNETNVKEKAWGVLSSEGIDKAKWDDCFDNKKTLPQIRADMAEGQSVGVSGTPSFVINGRLLVGAQPFEKFKAVIDDELGPTAKAEPAAGAPAKN
jgi:protein-disulfide isomerase